MLADLDGHRPEKIEFCLTEAQKEMFKDVLVLCEGAKSADEPIKVLHDKFNALFPDNEVVDRKYDDFEIHAIREEYCIKQENDVPKRKEELETVLAQIKTMKKNAEEAYASALLEVSDLAARVKNGITDFRLPSTKTARIALNGHYLFFAWVDDKFQLCKVQKIPDWDRSGLWSQEDVNQQAMKEVFGIEFPEVEKPKTKSEDQTDDAVRAFTGKTKKNGLLILPTGAGKSLVIADIASKLDSPLLIFCPSKEILEQNFAKLQSYGIFDCGVYSASVGCKDINRITFATIGSVMNHMKDFQHFKYVMVDECHLCNAKGGQYKTFFEAADRQVIGLTATPYRLGRGLNGTSMLKFLTRTRPRIFDEVLYYCQISELLAKGYLADLRYFDCTQLDMSNVHTNSTGNDFDENSLKLEYERSGFYDQLTSTTLRVLKPKNKIPRKGVLVFTRFTEEAERLTDKLQQKGINSAIVTGETPKKEREAILEKFKSGTIKVVSNVGVLTTGFDYPALDTVILARPTKSLSLYYQMVGRAIRPFKDKDGWIIDLGGSFRSFGKVSDLRIDLEVQGSSRWCIKSLGKQLTNVSF